MRKIGIVLIMALIPLISEKVISQQVLEKEPGLFSTGEIGSKATVQQQKKLLIRSAESLSGELTIKTGSSDVIELKYYKQARTKRKATGVDYIDLISVILDTRPDNIVLEMRAPNPPPWDKETEEGIVLAELVVPEDFGIIIQAASFDVTANGPFSSVVVLESLGKIEISEVFESLDVSTSNRRVKLENISGIISASTTNAALTAKSITCKEKAARFRNESGDITIEGAEGTLDIRNKFGRIDVTGFISKGSGNFIRGSSGPILVELLKIGDGDLVISNEYEDIELTLANNLSATLSLKVGEEGVIKTSEFKFSTDLVEHNRLNLILGEGVANISASIRDKGNIYVRGREGE
jgi:hypothetical protein